MILADLQSETLVATGYALLLLVIAAGLEMMGRHSHRRAGQYHNRGFRFHKHADHWECPQGARLERGAPFFVSSAGLGFWLDPLRNPKNTVFLGALPRQKGLFCLFFRIVL